MKSKVFRNYYACIISGNVKAMFYSPVDALEYVSSCPDLSRYTFCVLNPSTGEGVSLTYDELFSMWECQTAIKYASEDDLPF